MNQTHWQRLVNLFVILLVSVFAVYLRYLFRYLESGDFKMFTGVWYSAIKDSGFAAIGTDISNYTPPYLYLLYLSSVLFPDAAPVVAVKIPSIVFDFLCAWFVYLIVCLKHRQGPIPILAFLCVLLAPTVVVNSGIWGQADSIYSSMLLACVYFMMRGWAGVAMVAFGLAFAFKLQAMFLAPAVLALFLKGHLLPRNILLVPVVYGLAMMPAWIAGRPLAELATIYLNQAATYHKLTMNAPNLYAWLPQIYYESIVVLGLTAATAIVCLMAWLVWRSRVELTGEIILGLCTLSVIMTPYLLPKMHDRFFFPADLLAIAYAFVFPRQYFVPILVCFASFFAYQPFLRGREVVPMPLLAIIMGLALIAVASNVLRQLRGPSADQGG